MPWATRPRGGLLIFLMVLVAVACRGPQAATDGPQATTDPTITLTATATVEVALQSAVATPTPPATATPPPSPTAPPSPTIPQASPTPRPSPTADPAAGLPCPDPPPIKPDYAPYTLTAGPWPTPDPGALPPPLSLANPLPDAGRNAGYPYGSDGSGRYLLHNGLDMADENDALAVAPGAGTVIVARDDVDELFGWRCDWYGQLVILRLDEPWQDQPVYILFGHIKDVQVTEGQRVAAGDAVAREGAAGVALVPHLHLEVRVGANTFGATRNPLLWLAPWSGAGVISGRLVDPDGRAWQGVTVTLIDPRVAAGFLNTWTYLDDPDHLIRPDPALGENFVFGPVAEGSYDVFAQVQGEAYRQTVEVRAGELTTLEIVTAPYHTPTPQP